MRSKRHLACALATLAIAALLAVPGVAFAAKGEVYDYTIRVWGGNQGLVADGEMAEYTASYGDVFTLDKDIVTLSDSGKYYVKGFRLSGQDGLHLESFTVSEDMDFVVAYGVQGDRVPYTLSYVEYGTGRVLAEPVTRYGNVGDKPIEAFGYIDGYRPRYRNITGTLAADGSNEWVFEYIPLAEGESGNGAVAADAAAVGGERAAAGAAAAPGAPGDVAPGAPGDAGAPVVELPATEEILDEDVALASGADEGTGAEAPDAPVGMFAALAPIGAAAALALAVAAVLFLRRRRRQR